VELAGFRAGGKGVINAKIEENPSEGKKRKNKRI